VNIATKISKITFDKQWLRNRSCLMDQLRMDVLRGSNVCFLEIKSGTTCSTKDRFDGAAGCTRTEGVDGVSQPARDQKRTVLPL
jgi:hypothetical protein